MLQKMHMAQFHFVEDYEALVAQLLRDHPLDEAMSLAVGGDYERVGAIESAILAYAGLKDGDIVFDLGCGSGRLAHALGQRHRIDYYGTDVVQALIDYAAKKSPANYRFRLNRELSIPMLPHSVDIACAFSVFTHLLQAESYVYLREMRRALKPGGRVVFSFLEFAAPDHWSVFKDTLVNQHNGVNGHLNMFMERSAIDIWCERLGYERLEFVDGEAAPWGGEPLWQSLAILRKP